MKALLLCAGIGSRLYPLTKHTPKPLVDIAGRPLIWYWIKLLRSDARIQTIYINLHHLSEQITSYVLANFPNDDIIFLKEPELLGTAGTLFSNRAHWSSTDLLVIHADNFSLMDLKVFLDVFYQKPTYTVGVMGLFITDDPSSCGIVKLDDFGILESFVEKVQNPPGNLANAAVYAFDSTLFSALGVAQSHYDISYDVVPKLLGRLKGYLFDGYHRDIGTLDSLNKAREDISYEYEAPFADFIRQIS